MRSIADRAGRRPRPARVPRALIALLAGAVWSGQGPASVAGEVTLLPGPSAFRPLLADPREAHHVMRYLVGDGRARGEAAFGDTFGLLRVDAPVPVQFGVQASVYTRFNRDVDSVGFLDINSADYAIVFPVDVRAGDLDLRMGVGHLSSHLGEIEVQRRIMSGVVNYFDRSFLYRRDSVRVVASFDASESVRVYAGGSYAIHVVPNRGRAAAQAGAELVGRPRPWGSVIRRWYMAADVQSWAEADWAVSADVQAGLWINAAGSARGLRVAIDVYRGRSPQRILGLQRERYGGIALYFEL